MGARVGNGSFEGKLYHHSHEHYYGSHKGEALAWRNKLNNGQAHFIQFTEDVLYGSRYDSQIKAMLRANRSASQMDTDKGFAEALLEIQCASHVWELKSLMNNQMDAVDTEGRKGWALGSEPCSSKDGLEQPKQRLIDYMRLLHVSNGDDPLATLLLTPAGKYKPEFDIGGHQLPRFAGIICNTCALGTANHRSGIRLPPVDIQALLNAARGRHGEQHNNRLRPSDLYLTLPSARVLQNFNGWVTKLDETSGPVSRAQCLRLLQAGERGEPLAEGSRRLPRLDLHGSATAEFPYQRTTAPCEPGSLPWRVKGRHHVALGGPASGQASDLGRQGGDTRLEMSSRLGAPTGTPTTAMRRAPSQPQRRARMERAGPRARLRRRRTRGGPSHGTMTRWNPSSST